MPFLMTYWKQIAIGIFIVLVFGTGYYKGYSSQKQKFDAFKLQVEVNAKLQKDKNELLVKKQKQVTENIAKEYKDAVTKLKSHYAKYPNIKWVSKPNTSSCRVSEISSPPSSINGNTESDLPDTSGDIVLDCASDVLQLLFLQEWIENQLLIEN